VVTEGSEKEGIQLFFGYKGKVNAEKGKKREGEGNFFRFLLDFLREKEGGRKSPKPSFHSTHAKRVSTLWRNLTAFARELRGLERGKERIDINNNTLVSYSTIYGRRLFMGEERGGKKISATLQFTPYFENPGCREGDVSQPRILISLLIHQKEKFRERKRKGTGSVPSARKAKEREKAKSMSSPRSRVGRNESWEKRREERRRIRYRSIFNAGDHQRIEGKGLIFSLFKQRKHPEMRGESTLSLYRVKGKRTVMKISICSFISRGRRGKKPQKKEGGGGGGRGKGGNASSLKNSPRRQKI